MNMPKRASVHHFMRASLCWGVSLESLFVCALSAELMRQHNPSSKMPGFIRQRFKVLKVYSRVHEDTAGKRAQNNTIHPVLSIQYYPVLVLFYLVCEGPVFHPEGAGIYPRAVSRRVGI